MCYENGTLTTTVCGTYEDSLPLANITITGITNCPTSVSVNGQSASDVTISCNNHVLRLTSLESATQGGAWSGDLLLGLI